MKIIQKDLLKKDYLPVLIKEGARISDHLVMIMRKINQGIAMKINEADQGHRLLKIQICTIMVGDLKAEAIVDMHITGISQWVETTVQGKVVVFRANRL